MSKTTTLAAIIAAAHEEARSKDKPEGVWVDELDLAVKRSTPAEGTRPSKASAYDPTNGQEATIAWFGGDLARYENKIVRIGGKGNKAKIYKGNLEISIGKNGTLQMIGEASAPKTTHAPEGAPRDDSRGGGGGNPPPAAAPKVDPSTYFHREMAKLSLGYLHAFQYALDVRAKLKHEMTPEQFQACVSTVYISADKRGLFGKVPKLREYDDKMVPLRFIPPEPDPAALEAERLRLAEAEEAKRKADEAEKAAAAARAATHRPPQQENLDEDVPF